MKILADLMGYARSLGNERRKVTAKLEELKQQRDYLLTAPPPKSDVKQRLLAYVDSHRDLLRDNLQRQVPMLTHGPDADPAKIGGGPAILRRAMDGTFDHGLLLSIIGDAAKEKIAQAIETLDWPDAGPPCAERQRPLEKLNHEIQSLTVELAALNRAADDVKGEV